jgi:hypothetical protein
VALRTARHLAGARRDERRLAVPAQPDPPRGDARSTTSPHATSALIARQADLLRDDADLLDALSLEIDPPTRVRCAERRSPPAARVRRWLANGHPPDAATVDRVLAVARGEAVATETGDGRRVERHQQRLRLA